MFFRIDSTVIETEALGRHEFWRWNLYQGTPSKPGDIVCTSPGTNLGVGSYGTESEARTAIAAMRKSAGGMKFAKVVSA